MTQDNSAFEQAKAQLESIKELMDAYINADLNEQDADSALQRVYEAPLEVSYRATGWVSYDRVPANGLEPDEYRILLCTGGPAVQVTGDIGTHGEPCTAKLEYQNWFFPWARYPLNEADETILLQFAQLIIPN